MYVAGLKTLGANDLSNEMFGDEELNLWWHADRLSDESG